jgi:hypothetical protein
MSCSHGIIRGETGAYIFYEKAIVLNGLFKVRATRFDLRSNDMGDVAGAFRKPVGDGKANPENDGDGWDVDGLLVIHYPLMYILAMSISTLAMTGAPKWWAHLPVSPPMPLRMAQYF